MYDLDGGRHGSDDGLICDAYPDGDGADGTSIAVVAGTTDHSALPSSTGVSTKLRANTRALEDDGARSSVTEIGGAQSISVEDSSNIVRSGPRADLPQLGSTAAADPEEQGEAQQGRVRTPIVWGQGMAIRRSFDSTPSRAAPTDLPSRVIIGVDPGVNTCAILGDRRDRPSILSCSYSRVQRES